MHRPETRASEPSHEIEEVPQAAFRAAVNRAIALFLDLDLPVWLEGLGILLPFHVTDHRAHVVGDSTIIRPETYCSVRFEKCAELVGYHRERYPNVVETKHLVQRVASLLPQALEQRWSERIQSRMVRELFRVTRDEIVLEGFSRRLSGVGELCALFNRQGRTLSDWYAGADIFVVPAYRRVVETGAAQVFPRPELHDAFELLSAGYGDPLARSVLPLDETLAGLGFDESSAERRAAREQGQVTVAIFKNPAAQRPTLVFCTDGMRRRRSAECEPDALPARRSEFVFQLELTCTEEEFLASPENVRVPWRSLSLAWVLLHHSGQRGIRPGSGYSCGIPLATDVDRQQRNSLTGIFTSEFTPARLEHLSTDGPFNYVAIVGITEEEASIAERVSPHLLAKLLRHRALDQITKVSRPSLSMACASRMASLEQPAVDSTRAVESTVQTYA